MTQIATVEKKLGAGYVEISVPRKSACGHDCEECAGCGMTGAAIRARAEDPVGVSAGEKVVVESSTRKLLGVWRWYTCCRSRRSCWGISSRRVWPRVCAMPSPLRGSADVRADRRL